ncbi:MAG: oligoendopeptidase F, partial [Bacillota bacterium]|nr:oligoendopeptidase F [Bacillota bacterium]
MNLNWSLDELYSSFKSEEFKKDLSRFDELTNEYIKWSDKIVKDEKNLKSKLNEYISKMTEISTISSKIMIYSNLTFSVDTKNEEALKSMEMIEQKLTLLSEPDAKIQRWIGSLNNLQKIIDSSKKLKEYEFYL